MLLRLHAVPEALSSTSPSGRTSFWPWNSGSSYSTQLWAQRTSVTGWERGFLPGWPEHFSLHLLPPLPQVHGQALAPQALGTHQPRSTRMEAAWAQPEASAVSSQTSLLLPWQPGSEKRTTWRRHRRRGPQAMLKIPPPVASSHTLARPPHPRTTPNLPFLAWYSVCPGSSVLSSGMEAVSGKKSYGVVFLLPPTACYSKHPTSSVSVSTPTEHTTLVPNPPCPRSCVPITPLPQLPRD